MEFVFDGERTPGIELVERLLTTGERYKGELTPEVASTAIEALEHLELPWLVDEMVESGEMLAQQIHSQASRGLQEAVQNAQDQGASTIRLGLRNRGGTSELLIAHDGDPVEIHDVVSMAYPLLSGSRADPEKIGRFGVGLKTLNQISTSLSVHCPPLPGFEISGARIRRTANARAIPGFWNPGRRETLFVLRLREGEFDRRFFTDWMRDWDASSLVFLPTLNTVALVDLSTRATLLEHALVPERDAEIDLDLARGTDARRTTLSDSANRRAWTRYRVRYPVPKGLQATHKALAESVVLSVAVPNQSEATRIYTGLPLEEPWALPFSVSAPFDPNVDRTRLRDHNQLNEWLLKRLGDLAAAACLYEFAESPKSGWLMVPLRTESAGDRGSWLEGQSEALLARIRDLVMRRLVLTLADGLQVSLEEFVLEPAELQGVLTESDVDRLHQETKADGATTRRAVPRRWRDRGGRWREVLADLPGCAFLSVRDCLAVLDWSDEDISERGGLSWLTRFVAAALIAGAEAILWEKPCLVLADGSRATPADLSANGAVLLRRLNSASLAATLEVGEQLAPAFRARNTAARGIQEWLARRSLLAERPTDSDALRALARADRTTPLDLSKLDNALLRIRDALEQFHADEREIIAQGIGLNVALSGVEYQEGKRQPIAVRPADAYLPSAIDKNEGWPTAAAQTPRIQWVDPRYAEVLRTGRESRGQGALAFLRSLGAAVAPRLVPAPAPTPDPNARIARRRLSIQHQDELSRFPQAGGLSDDWFAPDLDIVLGDLTRVKRVADRRRRSRALFLCLDRAWNDRRDPYSARASATVVRHYYSWQRLGEVSATWLANLASQPWLSSQERKFTPKPPRELTVLTQAAFDIEGSNPEQYVHEIEPEHADSPLVEALGIQGRPWATTIIERLEDLREAEERGEEVHQAWADRCYLALNAYCEGGVYAERSNISSRELKTRFGSGSRRGLIRWRGQWLPPKAVRCGPFVGEPIPWVGEHQPLWDALDIAESDVADCQAVLSELASNKTDDLAEEVRAYRRVLELLPTRRGASKIRGLPVRAFTGWIDPSRSIVYAMADPALAEAVGEYWPTWRLPLPIDEIRPLAKAMGVVILDDDRTKPVMPDVTPTGGDIQDEFPAAVGHLRDFLVLNHPALSAKVRSEGWSSLAEARVVLGADWAVRVTAPGRKALQVKTPARVFDQPLMFCALDDREAAAHDAGGQAVARYLLGKDTSPEERSVVSMAWQIAFSQRTAVLAGLDLAPPESDEPEDAPLAPIRRRRSGSARTKRRTTGGSSVTRPEPRELVSLEELDLAAIRGTMLDSKRRGKQRVAEAPNLRDPERRPGRSSRASSSSAIRGYADSEREELAIRLMQGVLADAYGLQLADIHDQKGRGADLVDEEQDIWVELKTHGRDVADTVRFEPSEAIRAREKRGNYWLTIVWNLEKPLLPEYAIVPDPVARLDAYLGRGITLTGLRELSGSLLD